MLLRFLTRRPAFLDGFANLLRAIDKEELLLLARAEARHVNRYIGSCARFSVIYAAPRPPVNQALNQGIVLGVLYVPSLYLVAANKFVQASMWLGDGPGLGSNRFSRGGWNRLGACTV